MREKITFNTDMFVNWILWTTAFLAVACWLGGCNTIKGAAKDIYSATDALQASFSDTNAPEDSVRPHDWD